MSRLSAASQVEEEEEGRAERRDRFEGFKLPPLTSEIGPDKGRESMRDNKCPVFKALEQQRRPFYSSQYLSPDEMLMAWKR